MIRPWFRQAAVPWKTTTTQTRASGENRVSTKPGVLQGSACAAGPVSAGVLTDRAGVDRAEGRSSEGDEDCGVGSDSRVDAFAAGEPGADEVVGIAAVSLGAAGAGRDAAVAARR